MTPQQQKAKELVHKFIPFAMDNHIKKYALHNAKQCALIACDEIIEQLDSIRNKFDETDYLGCANHALSKIEFWKSVKQEITKLT